MKAARPAFETALRLTRESEDVWLTAQALRELASVELENNLISEGLEHVFEAEDLCREVGMNDLLVGVRALAGRLLLRAGRVEDALEWSQKAMREIRPGVELAHLVPLALSEVFGEMGQVDKAARYITLAYEQLSVMLSDLPTHAKNRAWANIPNHRAIRNRWTKLQPLQRSFLLPLDEAPSGRPLTAGELVEVPWTVHDPSDEKIVDRVERRRHRIVRLMTEAGSVGAAPTVTHLAEALDASEATIRRDLSALRLSGVVISTRGSR
jgi:hypothetical protein